MMGDADGTQPPPLMLQQTEQQQNKRIEILLKQLKSNEELPKRRLTAEYFSRSVAAATTSLDEKLRKETVEEICKILNKTNEDLFVLTHLLTLVRKLAGSYLIHALIPMGITKLIAYHAKHSSFHDIQDLSVQCLGDISLCCQNCQRSVAKTNVTITIMEVLEHLGVLTIKQQKIYSNTLSNIFRHTVPGSEECVISVKSEEHMLVVLNKLIAFQSPNEVIFDGLMVLREWMSIGGVDTSITISDDYNIMWRLFEIFNVGEDAVISALTIRVVGDLAYSHEMIAKKIYDIGFLEIIKARLLNPAGTPYDHDILWCLSKLLGMRRFPIVEEIYEQHFDLLELLIGYCYTYDTLIRREAIMCVINIVTFFKDDLKKEMFQEFFGNILIESIAGFTEEEDLSMIGVLNALFTLMNKDLKEGGNDQYKDLINEYGLEKTVHERHFWIKRAILNFDLSASKRKDVYKLLNLCQDTIDLIQNFKRSFQSSTVPLHCPEMLSPILKTTPTKNFYEESYEFEDGPKLLPFNILDDFEAFGINNNHSSFMEVD